MTHVIHYEEDESPSDARDGIMFWLNRLGRQYTVQEFINLGQTDRDKKLISDALSTFASLGLLKVDANKKIRLEGTLRR